ncbi:MAG: hypothetical protein HY678_10655 [Chloroflexi bacterium]|nr:hypothetical protein [Chloroflexota bacterium]
MIRSRLSRAGALASVRPARPPHDGPHDEVRARPLSPLDRRGRRLPGRPSRGSRPDAGHGSVRFKDARECEVELARWRDPYTGTFVTIPGALDVDHLVPLKHAHEAGAWRWPAERRRAYANDLSYRWHLVAVSASANRAKGDKGSDRWRPENREFWCQYAQAWAAVKFVYGLRSTAKERAAVREMLETCS